MVARLDTKYESDAGTIHRLLLSPDFGAAAGTAPTGAIDSEVRPKITKGNTEFGLRPRGVRLSVTVGTSPNTFKKYAFLPVLTPTAFGSATFALGATVSVGGVDYTVVGRLPEDY